MNLKECPLLKEAGVCCSNAGISLNDVGRWKHPEKAKRIADVCLNCSYSKCVFEKRDKEEKKRERLENTLLDLMGRAFLTNRQVKKLQEVQRKLEEMNGDVKD